MKERILLFWFLAGIIFSWTLFSALWYNKNDEVIIVLWLFICIYGTYNFFKIILGRAIYGN